MFKSKTIGYVSEIDQLLAEFEATHPKSESQQDEIKKYQRIYELRSQPATEDKNKKLFEEL